MTSLFRFRFIVGVVRMLYIVAVSTSFNLFDSICLSLGISPETTTGIRMVIGGMFDDTEQRGTICVFKTEKQMNL